MANYTFGTGFGNTSMQEHEVVVFDLTELNGQGYYFLGSRHAHNLPLILIADADNPSIDKQKSFISYSAADSHWPIQELAKAIQDSLSPGNGTRSSKSTVSPRARIDELAARIEETAEVLRLLRINSIGDEIISLLEISEHLRKIPESDVSHEIRKAVTNALEVLSRIFDQLSTVRGARLVISGVIAVLVGGSGWPAVTAMAVSLAFLDSKTSFQRALDGLVMAVKKIPIKDRSVRKQK